MKSSIEAPLINKIYTSTHKVFSLNSSKINAIDTSVARRHNWLSRHNSTAITKVCLIAVCLILLSAPTALAGAVGSVKDLGGVDLDRYCRNEYSSGYVVTVGSSAVDWRCKTGGDVLNISVDDVCKKQYNLSAYAHTDNWRDLYSWRCVERIR